MLRKRQYLKTDQNAFDVGSKKICLDSEHGKPFIQWQSGLMLEGYKVTQDEGRAKSVIQGKVRVVN